MDANQFKEYMNDQIHEIEVHKWIESEKAGYDLGTSAVKDWISNHAKEYREEWEREHSNS